MRDFCCCFRLDIVSRFLFALVLLTLIILQQINVQYFNSRSQQSLRVSPTRIMKLQQFISGDILLIYWKKLDPERSGLKMTSENMALINRVHQRKKYHLTVMMTHPCMINGMFYLAPISILLFPVITNKNLLD